MPLFNHKGEQVTPDEITSENFKGPRVKKIIAATDMDGTMFKDDLGPLVFLEKLSDPNFWDLETSDFARILVPKKYRELLDHGMEGEIRELDPRICALALDLADDITALYDFIQNIIKKNGDKNRQSFIREFARKMMELDRIFVLVDSTLAKYLDGAILMRTRFFAGKHPHIITHLAKRVMQRTKTSVDRYIHLDIEEQHRELAGQKVTETMIDEIHDGKESPYKKVDRVVKPVKDIFEFVQHAIHEADIPTIIATGNLKAIAKTAVKESPYSFMDEQDFRRRNRQGYERPPLVVGTWLRAEKDGTLHPRVKGKAVLGNKKASAVNDSAKERRKKLGIAIGDSPSTDGPMVIAALRREGVAIVVGKDIETIRRKFHGVFSQVKELEEKIYFSAESS